MLKETNRRTYVLDTSVLLSDPLALSRFAEHEVVIPLVVVMELEGKRHHVELGWMARRALRELETLRTKHGDLASPLPVNDVGGTVRVELNHVDGGLLPASMGSSNDNRILSVAANLASLGEDVTLVTKDLPLRLKASVVGVQAEEYRNDSVPLPQWNGVVTIRESGEFIDRLFSEGEVGSGHDVPVNAGAVFVNGSQSAIARSLGSGCFRLVPEGGHPLGVRPHSVEQRIALDLLLDQEVGIVSLGGRAGTGKTLLALAAALEAVLHRKTQRKVVVFRPLYAVAEQTLGYLPGSEDEKMAPWALAVFDALESIDPSRGITDKVKRGGLLEVLPITHIRGRTFTGCVLIIEEAQQWERLSLLSLLTRVGPGSRVFLTHDVSQRDNLRVGPYDGVAAVVEMLRGEPLFGHVTLTKQERSPVAELVSDILAGDQ